MSFSMELFPGLPMREVVVFPEKASLLLQLALEPSSNYIGPIPIPGTVPGTWYHLCVGLYKRRGGKPFYHF